MRKLLGAVGGLFIAVGAFEVLAHLLYKLPFLVLWLGLPLAVHDGLIVPLTLGAAYLGRKVLPRGAWGPVVIGTVVTGGLLLIAAATFITPATGVPGLLNRDYSRGLLEALAITWVSVLVLALVGARRKAHQPDGV